jgi:hypothetical protein
VPDAVIWAAPAVALAAWLVAVIRIVRHFDQAPAATKEHQ